MLKHIKKLFFPSCFVLSCAPVPHVLLFPKRKQKLPRRRQTARSLLTGTYYGKSDKTIFFRVLAPSLPGKNHCRSTTQLSMSISIDAADLKKWVDSYRKGAKEIPITYQRLK